MDRAINDIILKFLTVCQEFSVNIMGDFTIKYLKTLKKEGVKILRG